jgi:hypothetical protein
VRSLEATSKMGHHWSNWEVHFVQKTKLQIPPAQSCCHVDDSNCSGGLRRFRQNGLD